MHKKYEIVCFVFFSQPAMHGKIDPAVLASLPPSMQLDLLVQVIEFIKYFFRKSTFYILFWYQWLNNYSADERAFDCREQTKVSESQKGLWIEFICNWYIKM